MAAAVRRCREYGSGGSIYQAEDRFQATAICETVCTAGTWGSRFAAGTGSDRGVGRTKKTASRRDDPGAEKRTEIVPGRDGKVRKMGRMGRPEDLDGENAAEAAGCEENER